MGLLVVNQFCNPSYVGRLQVGLYDAFGNNLRLSSCVPIAQLVFHRLSSAPSAERLYCMQESAAYHDETSFIGGRAEGAMSEKEKAFYDSLVNNLSNYGFQ